MLRIFRIFMFKKTNVFINEKHAKGLADMFAKH